MTTTPEEQYLGDNFPLEIDEHKEAIINQYQQYLETRTTEELIEILTINKSKEDLIKTIMEEDQMGEENAMFEPL
jgi:hypothetical protein